MKELRKAQLIENIEYLVSGYENGMYDFPEMYKPLTKEEVIDYVYSQMFDIRVYDGGEMVKMGNGISDDLKFYGKENIENLILELSKSIQQ